MHLPFDQLEGPGEALGGVRVENTVVPVAPYAALRLARLALQRKHLRGAGAIVRKGIDARQAAPQQLSLDPGAICGRKMRQQASVPVDLAAAVPQGQRLAQRERR